MQEFVSLLGHGEEFLASLSLQPADSTSSSGRLSPAVESEMQGAESRGQAGQEEEDMVAAVESVLRELGEDPQREVGPSSPSPHLIFQAEDAIKKVSINGFPAFSLCGNSCWFPYTAGTEFKG